jgi:heme-degrading monooxygenase HmoA
MPDLDSETPSRQRSHPSRNAGNSYPKETVMTAKIIIQRRFQKDKETEIFSLLRELRSGAMNQDGYISGQTLTASDDSQTLVVISTWQDLASWKLWKNNATRQALEKMLEIYQDGPTAYREFYLGAFVKE